MTIYELTDQYAQLLAMVEEGEVDEQTLADTLEGLDGEIEDKADGYAKTIAQLNADAAGIKAEIERLTSKMNALTNNAKRMKVTLQGAMEAIGKTKFKTQLFSFGIQNNTPALKIDSPDKIPKEYLIPQDPKVDNAAIKQAIKDGAEFDWAHLEQSRSLRIG